MAKHRDGDVVVRELLRKHRQLADLRQAELAQRLGKTQSFVSKYESGERTLSLVEVSDVCAAVGVRLSAFVAEFEKTQ